MNDKIILTKEQKEKITSLYEDKNSIRNIAKILKVSPTVIDNFLHKQEENYYKHENYIAICKKTKKEFKDFRNKSGSLILHIKNNYDNIEIPTKFIRKRHEYKTGKYWHELFFDIVEFEEMKKEKFKCDFCNWTINDLDNKSGWFTTHLKKEHNIEVEQYLEIFPDKIFLFKSEYDRIMIRKFINNSPENSIECKICNQKMRKISSSHLLKHNISLKEYREKYGETLSNTSREKFSIIGINRNKLMLSKKENTKPEIFFEEKLKELNLKYEKQYLCGYFFADFKIENLKYPIEIDGSYWHGHDRTEEWNLNIFINIINDYKKVKYVNGKIFRIIDTKSLNYENFNQINTYDSLINFLDKENFNIKNHSLFNKKEHDILISIDKIKGKVTEKNSKKLISSILYLWKEFYGPDKYEKFIDINKRKSIEYKLKGIFFKELYSAKKIGNKSLFEHFENDAMLRKVIKYRLGLNKSEEYFDISIKNLYRGIEVRTMFNVGIFPVKQAKEIYQEFVKIENSIVYDPFSGWGSRAVAFDKACKKNKSIYIGNDSNENLKVGYQRIKEELIYNNYISFEIRDSCILNYEIINKVDFIFTSPPFYNDEIYHENSFIYHELEEWENKLLFPIFNNCYQYLKNDTYMVIDMKELYNDSVIKCAQKVGFKFIEEKKYKVNKSHYAKNEKFQSLLFFKKII